jgi:hypothetical protein
MDQKTLEADHQIVEKLKSLCRKYDIYEIVHPHMHEFKFKGTKEECEKKMESLDKDRFYIQGSAVNIAVLEKKKIIVLEFSFGDLVEIPYD